MSSCVFTEPKNLPLNIGGNHWALIPQYLASFSIVTLVSLAFYMLYLCLTKQRAPSSPPSLFSLACGKEDGWLKKEKGNAALQYIRFQRVMLFTALMYLVISAISLSINLTGEQSSEEFPFYQTTITNLSDNSPLHYFNIISSFILPWLVLVVIGKFMGDGETEKTLCSSCEASSTLVMEGIIQDIPSDKDIEDYYRRTYPKFGLLYISRVPDTRYLRKLFIQLSWVVNCMNQIKTAMKPDAEAMEKYEKEEASIKMLIKIEQDKIKSSNDFLKIVFLTFRSNIEAEKILIMEELDFDNVYNSVELAPCPHDIIWGNMRGTPLSFIIRITHIAFLLLVSTIATSPAAFSVKMYSHIAEQIPALDTVDGILIYTKDLLNTTMFSLFGLLMPYAVKIFTVYYGPWSMTKLISNYMTKLFFWLVMTTVIFPLLMLNNIKAIVVFLSQLPFISYLLKVEALDEDGPFYCLFIPTSGAFYINYLIVSACLRSQMRLHRIGDMIYSVWKVLINSCSKVKRKAALEYARNYCTNRNTYDNTTLCQDYVWCIVHFAILSCFCLICPLVSPAFLLYLGTTHLVDIQNFRICYSAREEQPMLIRTAAQLMIFCPLLGQLCNAGVQMTNKNQEDESLLSLTAGSLLILNLFLFLIIQSTGWTFPISVFGDQNKELFGEKMRNRRRYYQGEVYEDPALTWPLSVS